MDGATPSQSLTSPIAVRVRFSLKHLFVVLAAASIVASVGRGIWLQTLADEEVAHAQHKLKRIVSVLQEYQRSHGTLPYSEKGPGAALFLLHQLTHPGEFECRTRNEKRLPARWDWRLSQLLNGDIGFLNEPHSRLDSSRVIVACDLDVIRQLYATGDGVVRRSRQPIPDSQLLGSWVTIEGFLVIGKSTFDKWCETHPLEGPAQVRTMEEGPGPYDAQFNDGSNVQYYYVDGRLSGCTIIAANGSVIDEAVETDRYGCITAISR
jgi:hypothetical protein